jgi:hypothetical protein
MRAHSNEDAHLSPFPEESSQRFRIENAGFVTWRLKSGEKHEINATK